ncbi:hypothetical protein BIY24_03030 [Halobacteriovorax marinus]|uniref:type III pantothenate kinase n=1 Tax=Halobacteriovorax marinus TaxID=97084 RepID=UPI000BC33D0F|nr:type III pantothenate kinase [Halobacteriovorax marinus]ATH06944.1 hypothetical protein BIY24_03030 [Halobacteriovorax marinus]
MYNLQSIDNGNSHPHVGLFEKGELKSVTPLAQFQFDQQIDAIASSVGPSKNLQSISYIDLRPYRKEESFLDMPVDYEMTLGEDRLHQAYYIFKKAHPGLSLLIDAGTFTTVDFIDESGMKGGYIFPGVQTFLNSYSRGDKLPSLASADNFTIDFDIPHSTNAAIENAMKISQLSWLEKILSSHPIEQIYLSGGHGSLFSKALEDLFKGNVIFEKNLIHFSLYEIYLYLKNNKI